MPSSAITPAGVVLVVNAGSSSLKVSRSPGGPAATVERLALPPPGAPGAGPETERILGDALSGLLGRIGVAHAAPGGAAAPEAAAAGTDGIAAVAHRVVHGGERFTTPTPVDDAVAGELERLVPLAPLHMPANLAALRVARRMLPQVPHVAVFDTAFHAGLPPRAARYAVPEAWYREHGVRKYGFHGPSHDGASRRVAELLGRPREALRIVTLHLGNGASATAVDRGRSVDTSMGFTPLAGLPMGTRPGDLDPGVVPHLLRRGLTLDALEEALHRGSGLLGLSGRSHDVRDLRGAAAEGDGAATLALEVFAYRVRCALGAYAFAMGALDAVAFTGGIGEHDAPMRERILEGLDAFGIVADPDANRAGGPRIDAAGAGVALFVLPTDEEGVMADAARRAVAGGDAA